MDSDYENDMTYSDDNVILINSHNAYNIPLKGSENDINHSLRCLPNIPPEVVNVAINIANKLYKQKNCNDEGIQIGPKVLKKDSKDKRDFVCIFAAFNELGCPVDQEYVADLIKFQRSNMEKAFKENGLNITINPILLSKFYVRRLNDIGLGYTFDIENVAKNVENIINTCNNTKTGRDIISGNPVKTTAIGALYLYLTIFNSNVLEIFRSHLAHAWYISPTSYKRYYELISFAYNSLEENPDTDIKVWYEIYI